MNRMARGRLHGDLLARSHALARPHGHADIEATAAAALAARRAGDFATARNLCRSILDRDPDHAPTLALMGEMAQREGRNQRAVKLLRRALAADPRNAMAHDSLALAFEALGRHAEAEAHYAQAIALGLAGAEALVKEGEAVAAALARLASAWPRQLLLDELLGPDGLARMAEQALLIALLQTRLVCDLELERFLTAARAAMLRATADVSCSGSWDLRFPCALAQQCFINEYVFPQHEEERGLVRRLRDRMAAAISAGEAPQPRDLAVAAMYAPLHELANAAALPTRPWPRPLSRLLTQQIVEPTEEADVRSSIPVLTPLGHELSLKVQRQYDENPYPRWTTLPQAAPMAVADYLQEKLGYQPAAPLPCVDDLDILVAGCGTGAHSIETAQRFPRARVLAIDISRESLAYAVRKTREAGLANVEYAQGDILKLEGVGRTFDMIETVGVLHHLPEPAEGWRILLSLLRPGGLMLVGIFSALGRRPVNAARAFARDRGYGPTPDDIRACRQELILRGQAMASADFYSLSGCRALWFNAVEHQFSIHDIKACMQAHGLRFLGFELAPQARARFERRHGARWTDLECWQAFEQDEPWTFAASYLFWVQKGADLA
jgi:SAM-dependent methyltransferase/Flp pilus assembly protein TadD